MKYLKKKKFFVKNSILTTFKRKFKRGNSELSRVKFIN